MYNSLTHIEQPSAHPFDPDVDPNLAAQAQGVGSFRNVVGTAPANPIATEDPLRPEGGTPDPNMRAFTLNAVNPAAPLDFDPTQPVGNSSFFARLAARMNSLAGSISQSLQSVVSMSQASQSVPGTRIPTELLLSNHNPAGDVDVGLWGDQITTSQPDVMIGSALTGSLRNLSLSGSGRTSSSIVSYIGSSSSGPFDPNSQPRGMPLGSRFVEAYPLVYSINGIAPPPPGFVPGRMSPDPLPLRKYQPPTSHLDIFP